MLRVEKSVVFPWKSSLFCVIAASFQHYDDGNPAGLKIQCPQGRAGSSPAYGTLSAKDLRRWVVSPSSFNNKGEIGCTVEPAVNEHWTTATNGAIQPTAIGNPRRSAIEEFDPEFSVSEQDRHMLAKRCAANTGAYLRVRRRCSTPAEREAGFSGPYARLR